MAKRATLVLLPLLFFSFSLGEIARVQFPNALAFTLTDIIVGVSVLIWLSYNKKKDYQLKKPYFIFVAVALFSLLVNFINYSPIQLFVSSTYLVRWVFYAEIYFLVSGLLKKEKLNVQNYMFWAGVFILILGYVQFFLYPGLRNLFYAGWDEHLYRMFSTFLDPNFAGAFFVLFLIFIFPKIESYLIMKDKKNVFIFGLIAALTIIAIFLTYSRSAILMLGASALAYSVLKKRKAFIFSAIGITAIVFVIMSPRFYIENTNLLRTVSTKARLNSALETLNISSKNPVLGTGFNTYRYAREKYGYEDKSRVGPSHAGAGTDNSFLFVLATTGIIGFISYLYLIFIMFKMRNFVLTVSLVGLIVDSFFINSLFYSFIMLWLWVLAGLTENT